MINALLLNGCRAWRADRREGAPGRSAGARSKANPLPTGRQAEGTGQLLMPALLPTAHENSSAHELANFETLRQQIVFFARPF